MKRIVALFVVAVWLVCASAWAVETDESQTKPDDRLTQKVTYECEAKGCVEAMAELSKLTGVTIKAGLNDADWQSRDRKITMFVKDIPLTNLMNSMARVMKFTWSRSKDDPPAYRFYMARRTRLEAEELVGRQRQLIDERRAQAGENLVRAFKEARNLSAEDIAKLKEEDPGLYLYASSGIAASLGDVFEQSPEFADAIATGRQMTLKAATMSPEGQQAMLRLVQSAQSFDRVMTSGRQSDGEQQAPSVDRLRLTVGSVSAIMDEMGEPFGAVMCGMLRIEGVSSGGEVPLIDVRSNLAKLAGKAVVRAEAENRTLNDYGHELQSQAAAAVKADVQDLIPGDPAPEHPDDPAMKVKVKLEKDSRKPEAAFKTINKSTEFSCVSDSFRYGEAMQPWQPTGEETELGKALDAMSLSFEFYWQRHGTALEIRNSFWFKRVCEMVSEEQLEKWRQKLKKNGVLEITDLMDMAKLTLGQVRANLVGDPVLGQSYYAVAANLECLRLLSSLNEAQWKNLFSEVGLDVASLSEAQWDRLNKAFAMWHMELPDSEEGLSLTANRTQKDERVVYVFAVRSSGAEQPGMHFGIDLPHYEAPKEEPKVEEKPKVDTAPAAPGR